MLTVVEVAEMLYVHPHTVKRISDRGELPFYRINTRGDRRYKLSDVQDYILRMSAR